MFETELREGHEVMYIYCKMLHSTEFTPLI